MALALNLSSCRNEDAAREEENASVVNIEKGVASPMWTSDAEMNPAAEGIVETVQEVQMDDIREESREQDNAQPSAAMTEATKQANTPEEGNPDDTGTE